MSDEQREATLKERRARRLPWHSPPHFDCDSQHYLVTSACFEHAPIIGRSPDRMGEFSEKLVVTCRAAKWDVFAWAVLPNHYHALIRAPSAKCVSSTLGQLHGGTSYRWNREESLRGRQVWCSSLETGIKSERHFWASLLYVLHNPVKHGYVRKWQDWPYSNAEEWLATTGSEAALRMWKEYPIDDFGRDWDPPDL